MGLFARFSCLRREGTTDDLASAIREMLRERNVIETDDPAAVERMVLVAPAGDGWFMVFDHAEDPFAGMADADGLLAGLPCTPGTLALDVLIADSDDLLLLLTDGGEPQAQLAIGRRGVKDGALAPWQRLLRPGQTVENIRTAFAARTTFVEEHLRALKPLFGIDLAAFDDVGRILSGEPPSSGVVLLRLKAVPAPGQTVGTPRLEVNELAHQNLIQNGAYPQIPFGLVGHFPGFSFDSRGGGARGLEVGLSGSAVANGLIEIVSATLRQRRPAERRHLQDFEAVPTATPAGAVLRFDGVEVPDWINADLPMHELMVFVYCRALKEGEGELVAEARLVAPASVPARTSFPVTVLPPVWLPLKGRDRPSMIHDVRALSDPARINGLAVLRGGPEEAVAALSQALKAWRSRVEPGGTFWVQAATEPASERDFYRPVALAKMFKLDLSKKRQAKWDRLMADLPSIQGLSLTTDLSARESYAERYAARVAFHYTAPAPHPRLPPLAARLGHLALSVPAGGAGEAALVALMGELASQGMLHQAYVSAWDHEDGPDATLYERAATLITHRVTAQGWGTRYLRAVGDRLWLGPELAARLPDRPGLERVAAIGVVGDALAIERHPAATLRDLELCLEPLLASHADSAAFTDSF